QPARALFLAARALRDAGRHIDALEHVDTVLPTFPLDSAGVHGLLRQLAAHAVKLLLYCVTHDFGVVIEQFDEMAQVSTGRHLVVIP
ncbi:MAG: hypothetical protein NTY98_30060, partial [Verrucomicrobia bacterium]|nr:hypothetical protein [Verrucomicrobiota bacterium]